MLIITRIVHAVPVDCKKGTKSSAKAPDAGSARATLAEAAHAISPDNSLSNGLTWPELLELAV